MQVQLNPKNFSLSNLQKHIFEKRLKKLQRLCKMFKPDSVLLHAALSENNLPKGYSIRLNLSVLHHDFAAMVNNPKFGLALGQAFEKIVVQLRKFRAKLRHTNTYVKVAKEKGKV